MLVEQIIIILALAVLAGGGVAALSTGELAFLIAGAALAAAIIAAYIVALRIERANERRMHKTPVTLIGDTLDGHWQTVFGRGVPETIDLTHAEVVEVVRGTGVITLHFWPAAKREGSRKGYIGNVSADRVKRSAPEVIDRVLAISKADAPAVQAALDATNLTRFGALTN